MDNCEVCANYEAKADCTVKKTVNNEARCAKCKPGFYIDIKDGKCK